MDISKFKDLDLSSRILLGPGPSMVPPRVLNALSTPPVGHLDPEFLGVLAEVKELLRFTFQTKNEVTFPISGTGSAGMEAALCNFIEPGDRVLIATNGYFGERLAEIAKRYGAQVDRLEHAWGDVFLPDEIEEALQKADYKLFAIVHGETSTGALQGNVKEIAELVHAHGALLVLDTVASLGGVPVKVDEWDVDICYSGSQKCLSAPPGLAPMTVSPRAMEVLMDRKTPVANWYLDFTLLTRYWGKPHVYHHTVPVNMIFALREALRLVAEEGLEERFARHRTNSETLWQGLEDLGMPPIIPLEHRLASLTTPKLPKGIDEKSIRRRLLTDFNVEISGGFGPFAGMIWRIGLMGFSSRRENVILLLSLMKELLFS
ncbi:MAG: alanine--glyoxylate aminotransferase family protein [Anaerolineales bacterium]|nr:alanine--glyoxylate aminotransferase family protein [Anaerolineales bacterium]HEY61729.1 alanine--glyoxylate aminotransferase family protein [Anaerolineae bacterium]